MKALLLLVVALFTMLPARWVAAALPVLWIAQRLLPPELSALVAAGPVELAPVDIIILLLTVRLALTALLRRELVVDRTLYLALGAYLIVNLVATLIAGIKFGELQLVRCMTSWARLVSEVLVVPIVAAAVQTLPQAKLCIRVLLGTLTLLAALQFVNFFGAGHGLIIGEVQGVERGELRYFGPVGDAIGVVLLLGYVAALCFANVSAAALFLGGILLTAGLGAMFATAVGTGFFLLFGTRTVAVREFVARRLWLLPLIALGAVLALTLFAQPLARTLIDRLTTGTFASSGAQRGASATLALSMIVDHPLLGVGYMGYERALPHYGGDKYFDLNQASGATANANNQLLQSLCDSGVLGLVALGALIVCAARLFLRIAAGGDRFSGTFFLAAFIWLLAQVFGNIAAVWLNPSSFVARLLWFSLGVAVAAARLLPVEPRGRVAKQAESPEPQLVAA